MLCDSFNVPYWSTIPSSHQRRCHFCPWHFFFGIHIQFFFHSFHASIIFPYTFPLVYCDSIPVHLQSPLPLKILANFGDLCHLICRLRCCWDEPKGAANVTTTKRESRNLHSSNSFEHFIPQYQHFLHCSNFFKSPQNKERIMRKMAKPAIIASFVILSALFHQGNGLRGALVRTGRALKNWHETTNGGDVPLGNPGLDRALFFALRARQQEQQHQQQQPAEEVRFGFASPIDGNAFLRFGRSLYDAGAEGSSILRSQRGILQQDQPIVVIDADDGQLMRYGRGKK